MALTEKVALNNLCSWPVYFKRANGVGDVRIPANAEKFSALDMEEVRMQIQLDNKLFTGTDSSIPGSHARLFITDAAQRNELFGITCEDAKDVLVLTSDTIKEILNIRTKKEFNESLQALVTTDAEKKMVVELAKKVGGDDVAAWKMEAIYALAETSAV